ncbi:hypothetical protein [Neorhodopirellula lusitana]|uniref:hypothetical protein n=1 Tax=Neorhodopirellula lusitana TaxID=445327 RepID=UPI00384B89C5
MTIEAIQNRGMTGKGLNVEFWKNEDALPLRARARSAEIIRWQESKVPQLLCRFACAGHTTTNIQPTNIQPTNIQPTNIQPTKT